MTPLFDITLGNCTSIMEMNPVERISYFATQKPIIVWVIASYILLALLMLIYGVSVSLGRSEKALITNPHFLIFFIFWLIIGIILIGGLFKPLWILPFV